MTLRRRSTLLSSVGALLFAAALVLWWQGAADHALHAAWLADPHGASARLAAGLSALGGLAALGPLAILVALGLAWRGRRRDALWLAVTITLGRLLVEGLKEIVRRPRPPIGDRLADVTSWSFPSSHSAGTMMTGLAFALLTGGRWPAMTLALLVTAAIGWSRVALGVHWPSDVLAGWGFGLAWIGVASRWRAPS